MRDIRKEQIQRGDRTTRLIEDKDIRLTLEELRQDIFILWEKTAGDQEDERERLYRELHGLKALRVRLSRIIEAGKKAQVSIENAD